MGFGISGRRPAILIFISIWLAFRVYDYVDVDEDDDVYEDVNEYVYADVDVYAYVYPCSYLCTARLSSPDFAWGRISSFPCRIKG